MKILFRDSTKVIAITLKLGSERFPLCDTLRSEKLCFREWNLGGTWSGSHMPLTSGQAGCRAVLCQESLHLEM